LDKNFTKTGLKYLTTALLIGTIPTLSVYRKKFQIVKNRMSNDYAAFYIQVLAHLLPTLKEVCQPRICIP